MIRIFLLPQHCIYIHATSNCAFSSNLFHEEITQIYIEGNLSKGIVIWAVRREGIEPIKRVFTNDLFSVTLFLRITRWFKIAIIQISAKKVSQLDKKYLFHFLTEFRGFAT